MKILNYIQIIAVTLIIIGCGGKEPEVPEVSNATEIEPVKLDILQTGDYNFKYSSTLNKMYGSVEATYNDYATILADQKTYLHMNSTNATYIQQTLDALPKGGIVTIKIFRGTIEGANTKHFMFVVTKDGKELSRVLGKDILPNTPLSGPFWYNTQNINLDGFINFHEEVKIDVIDMMSDTIDTILLTRKSDKTE